MNSIYAIPPLNIVTSLHKPRSERSIFEENQQFINICGLNRHAETKKKTKREEKTQKRNCKTKLKEKVNDCVELSYTKENATKIIGSI